MICERCRYYDLEKKSCHRDVFVSSKEEDLKGEHFKRGNKCPYFKKLKN